MLRIPDVVGSIRGEVVTVFFILCPICVCDYCVQIKRYKAPPGELHVPPKPAASQEQVKFVFVVCVCV